MSWHARPEWLVSFAKTVAGGNTCDDSPMEGRA